MDDVGLEMTPPSPSSLLRECRNVISTVLTQPTGGRRNFPGADLLDSVLSHLTDQVIADAEKDSELAQAVVEESLKIVANGGLLLGGLKKALEDLGRHRAGEGQTKSEGA